MTVEEALWAANREAKANPHRPVKPRVFKERVVSTYVKNGVAYNKVEIGFNRFAHRPA